MKIVFLIISFVLNLTENVLSKYVCVDRRTNKTIKSKNIELTYKWQYFAEAPNIYCPRNESLAQNFTLKGQYLLSYIFGIDIVNSTLFYLNDDKHFEIRIYFEFVYFDFYRNHSIDKSQLVNIASSKDLIASYHGLGKDLADQTNITQLYNGFESMFPTFRIEFTLGANVLLRSELSRLLFKNANIFYVGKIIFRFELKIFQIIIFSFFFLK